MGNSASSSTDPVDLTLHNDGKTYRLCSVPRAGCCPDVWHQHPKGAPYMTLENERRRFPRDTQALLKGSFYRDLQGSDWFIPSHVKNKGKPWKTTPPGAALPFAMVMEVSTE